LKKNIFSNPTLPVCSHWRKSFYQHKQELESLADELAPGKGVEAAARKIQEHHPTIEQFCRRI